MMKIIVILNVRKSVHCAVIDMYIQIFYQIVIMHHKFYLVAFYTCCCRHSSVPNTEFYLNADLLAYAIFVIAFLAFTLLYICNILNHSSGCRCAKNMLSFLLLSLSSSSSFPSGSLYHFFFCIYHFPILQ